MKKTLMVLGTVCALGLYTDKSAQASGFEDYILRKGTNALLDGFKDRSRYNRSNNAATARRHRAPPRQKPVPMTSRQAQMPQMGGGGSSMYYQSGYGQGIGAYNMFVCDKKKWVQYKPQMKQQQQIFRQVGPAFDNGFSAGWEQAKKNHKHGKLDCAQVHRGLSNLP